MENKEIYLILAFKTVHDWAICFQQVIYCGTSTEQASQALAAAKETNFHLETQVWKDGVQVRRSLYSNDTKVNNLIENDS